VGSQNGRWHAFGLSSGLQRLIGKSDASLGVGQKSRAGRSENRTTAGSFEHRTPDYSFEVPYPFTDRGLAHHQCRRGLAEAASTLDREEERQIPKVKIHN
jgi:hypothetical protein